MMKIENSLNELVNAANSFTVTANEVIESLNKFVDSLPFELLNKYHEIELIKNNPSLSNANKRRLIRMINRSKKGSI